MESSSLEDAWAMAIPNSTTISTTEGLEGVCLELVSMLETNSSCQSKTTSLMKFENRASPKGKWLI